MVVGGTDLGEALFSRSSGDLSVELLGHIEEEDPELIPRVFERRRRRRVEQARDQLAGKSLDEQVAVLAKILDGEGYLADFDKLRRRQLPDDPAQLRHLGSGVPVRSGLRHGT